MEHDKKVVVVIVTYNGAAWIPNCLVSLAGSSHPVDVIVVDNGSSDKTIQLIKERFAYVTLLEQESNLGFGKANNVGIAEALKHKADYVFLLNQDTVVDIDCVARLVIHASELKYAIISPVHYNGNGTDLDEGFKRYIASSYTVEQFQRKIHESSDRVYEVSFVNAAAWFVPVTTFKEIGGFAPLFFHYGEDRDFINRLHYFSAVVGVLPAAVIYHCRETRDIEVIRWDVKKKRRYYYVGILSRVANINLKVLSGLFDGVIWAMKESCLLLSKGDFFSPIRFFNVTYDIIRSMPAIRLHRKQVKSKRPYQFLPCESE